VGYLREVVVGYEIVEAYGGRIDLVEFVLGKSANGIIDKIHLKVWGQGNVKAYNPTYRLTVNSIMT